jgi:hypothetical protein
MLTYSTQAAKWRNILLMLAFFMLLINVFKSAALYNMPAPGPNGESRRLVGSDHAPLYFEENAGQADPSVRFMSHVPGGTILFTSDEVMLRLAAHRVSYKPALNGEVTDLDSALLRLQFIGANTSPEVRPNNALPGKVNYLLGSDPARWHTNLATFAQISYLDLYNGVTLKYEGDNRSLKGTYLVAPGADPEWIRWRYLGAQSVSLSDEGNLEIVPGAGSQVRKLVEHAPLAWQDIDGKRLAVPASYALASDDTVGFSIGRYDRAYPLVIDPTLVFSTYLGGEDQDQGLAIVTDKTGAMYITGEAESVDFPTTAGAFQPTYSDGLSDAFVTKFAPDGATLLYSTFLGGNLTDISRDIYVDSEGNAYLTGSTTSNDFPTTPNAFQTSPPGDTDAFVTKLNPSGSALVYSTYLGGIGELGGDDGYSITADAQGNAYISGVTGSRNFPLVNPFQADCRPGPPFCHDVFVSKLNPQGSALIYSTFLGGRSVFEEGQAIAVNAAGNAYVVGFTDSDDFPLQNPIKPTLIAGDSDVFLTKFSTDGSSLVYSTYLGGYNGTDEGYGIALDTSENAYVVGWTDSSDFPMVNPVQSKFGGSNDAFVAKVNSAGSAILFSTFLGVFGTDIGYDIALDPANNMYITGYTSSEDFPVVNAVQPTYGGFYDAFVAELNAAGSSLIYSTYLGGTSYEHGYGIAVRGGTTYVTGDVVSTDFPTANPFQATLGGDGSYTDAFVVKISDGLTATPTVAATQTSTPAPTATGGTPVSTPTATATVTACAITFSDVPAGNTFYSYVRCLACQGIISGYDDGTFRPNNDITRGQLSKIVANSAGFNEPAMGQTFEDVAPDSTFYPYVERMAARGIIGGYPCGGEGEPCGTDNKPYFRPNVPATRGQVSKIISEARGYSDPQTEQTFEDVPAGSTFHLWIERLASRGIIGGYPCGGDGEPCGVDNKPYFRPNAGATRGQSSKIVANAFFPNCNPAIGRPIYVGK